MNEKILKSIFYGCLTVFVGVLAFFILYNAQWLVGDDAIIIRHTGWGHLFEPSDTIIPSSGRFFPLSYFVYNILWIFGLTSINAHFGLMTITFIFMSLTAYALAQYSLKEASPSIWKYIALFSIIAICMQRSYNNYLDAFSTVWFGYFWILVWCICCYFVHAKQSPLAAVAGFIVISYFCYCGETVFLLPLSYGVCGLLFGWANTSKLEKAYLWSLLGTAIVFLLVYYFVCYIHIEEAYDGSHGSEVTLFGNAFKMFIAQKVLWVGLIVFGWRMYRILFRKEQYEFWDTMLLAAFGFCCGCAILKLNWVLYYSQASIFMIPTIAHYMNKYFGSKWCAIILFALALFLCRSLPKYIKENQNWRNNTTEMMNSLEKQYMEGATFYWYEPTDDRDWCFDMEFRAWLRECMQTQLGWQVGEEYFKLNVISEFDKKNAVPGIYMVSKQNEKLFPGINENLLNAGECITKDKERDIQCVLIQ